MYKLPNNNQKLHHVVDMKGSGPAANESRSKASPPSVDEIESDSETDKLESPKYKNMRSAVSDKVRPMNPRAQLSVQPEKNVGRGVIISTDCSADPEEDEILIKLASFNIKQPLNDLCNESHAFNHVESV